MVKNTRYLYFMAALALPLAACADPQSSQAPIASDAEGDTPPDSIHTPAPPYPQDDVVAPETDDALSGDVLLEDSAGGSDPDAGSDSVTLDAGSEEPQEVLEPADDVLTIPGLTPRTCTATFHYSPESPVESVHLAVSYLEWGEGALAMSASEDGSYTLDLDLSEVAVGSYGYKLILNKGSASETWILDPSNKMKRFDDGFVNSKLLVPDCRKPELHVVERDILDGGQSATLVVAVQPGVDTDLDLSSLKATHNFDPIDAAWDPNEGTLTVTLNSLPTGKHSVRFDAASVGDNIEAEPVVVSFWHEDTPFEWRDATLYFAFTDRFRDGAPTSAPDPCLPADATANWLGGDWQGITDAINEGYFDTLGINTLWLNAPMDNPEGCVSGLYDRQYTAFHAYFPVDLYSTEERFGSLSDLRALVSAAHDSGMRVIVDLPANHLYESALEVSNQPSSWFNDDGVCRELGWVTPETCWFEPYLPDLNYRNDTVVEYMTEIALWWVIEADLDGFRVDAVKHMHPHFLNTLRAKLDARIEANSDQLFWTIGETFTGGWQSGGGSEAELVKAYISGDQLYGQFDFPLYWPLREAFAQRSAPLSWLAEAALGSKDFYGAEAIMSSFLGNHDVTRFINVANGDNLDSCPNGSTVVGWDCPPAQPSAEEAYQRLRDAFIFLASYSAVPLIYYGDEIGLAGAGDPDNRRIMPWEGLNEHQASLREDVSALFGARLANSALRRGTFAVLSATEATLVIERALGQSRAYAVFNQGETPLTVAPPVTESLTLTNVLNGDTIESSDGTLTWQVPANSAALWTTSL